MGKTSLELSVTGKEESWTAKEQLKRSMLQEMKRAAYSWERTKALTKNLEYWRILADPMLPRG